MNIPALRESIDKEGNRLHVDLSNMNWQELTYLHIMLDKKLKEFEEISESIVL